MNINTSRNALVCGASRQDGNLFTDDGKPIDKGTNMYCSQEDYIIEQYQDELETIVDILTDEQKWELVTMANVGSLSHSDKSIEGRVNMFVHHVWEGTDLCAQYVIDEQCPQRFEGVPNSGKTHDAVEEHVKRAFSAGIEFAIQWLFAEIDVYDWKR